MKRLILMAFFFIITFGLVGCTVQTVTTTTVSTEAEETTTLVEEPLDNDSLIEEIAALIKGIFVD